MNREEIKQFLPHREPMLLVDWTEGNADGIRATYHVTGEEWFLRGHFPGFPVVPGVITCEIMAQSCTLILGEQLKGKTPFYAGLDKVRFKNPVVPGDTFETYCEITKARPPFYFAKGEGYVDGKKCVSAEFSFVVQKSEA